MTKTDRQRGCLYGLAIGDALGAAVEFRERDTFPLVTCYRDGGPHSLAKGQWTDDTSLALALAHSIGEQGWDLNDQLARYLDWFQNGAYSVNGVCFDIGCTTRDALNNYERDHNPYKCADPSPGASGNGSIMRLAPVPIMYGDMYNHDLDELMEKAEQSSLTTHASEQCQSACRYMTLVLAGLMDGRSREEVLSPSWPYLQMLKAIKPLNPLVEEVAEGSFRNKTGIGIRGGGWVVQSLEAALWAFHEAANFREAVLRAVNLGDDADTTGAVCGQFAGAYWGESGIPQDLREGLARQDMIEAALWHLGVVEYAEATVRVGDDGVSTSV
jgi:ADP-ribosylglycohydrolase